MFTYPQNRQLDQQTLRKILIALMLKQQQDGPVQAQKPEKSSLDQILETAKKGKETYDQGESLYNLIAGNSAANALNSTTAATANTATQAAWNQAAGEASQAAWNAGADAATKEAGSQLAADNAASGLGNVAGGLAGAYMAYKGGDQILQANKVGGVKGRQAGGLGGLQAGLGAGLALNAAGLALGPVGWAALIGAGLLGGGLAGSRLGDKDKWKTEGKRLGKLIDSGVNIPESLQIPRSLQKGRSKAELVNPNYANDFIGQTKDGFVNNKFANSRSESDLRPEDIWGYSGMFERYGNDWLGKFNEQQRRDIAQKALNAGAVKEHHGTIDVDWSKVQGIPSATPIPAQKPVQPAVQTPTNPPQVNFKNRSNFIPRR